MKGILIFLISALLVLTTSVSYAECVCENENDPNTPLNQAILAMSDNTLALELLSEGMNPDTTNACGAGLLHMAAIYGDATLAEKLLEKDANPNIMNYEGHAPMQSAAEWSNNEVLAMLLEAGGDPNPELISCRKQVPYNTPLLGAAVNNNIEGARLLLEHGADFMIASSNGATFFDLLLRNGNDLEKILELIESLPEKEKEKAKHEVLFEVARREDMLSELNYLLSMSLSPDFSIDDTAPYNTPLLMAALSKNIDGVKALVEHGADIHYTNSKGYSLERIVKEESIEELYYLFPSFEE